MARKRSYIFTNRVQSKKGILATIFGLVSLIAVVLTIYLTYGTGQGAPANFGISLLLALLFSLTGFVVSIVSRFEKDVFYLFSYIGMVVNFITLACISFLLYAGARGI